MIIDCARSEAFYATHDDLMSTSMSTTDLLPCNTVMSYSRWNRTKNLHFLQIYQFDQTLLKE